ncbi:MAG: transcriptional repressor [Selenomonadales bacterium]|nr:transcriptional repressor [Selenomonadales bacterium]
MNDQSITDMLREKGFKVTPQRLAVYRTLAESKEHPSAEMIFSQLKETFPTMSLATVYKTVDVLAEIGLVQKLNVGEDSFRYDAWVDDHSHIRCTSCGRVDDLAELDAAPIVNAASVGTDYKITGQQFYFYGVCKECQKKQH